MDSFKKNEREREEIFTRSVKARRRTYFFDVKETKDGERYLTITESKRCFNNEQGNFYYEKHKIFLYNEDIENFLKELNISVRFIETGEAPPEEPDGDNNNPPSDFESELDSLKI